ERAYESLIEACTQPGASTVVVVGDSGSGKSSLLAAGLVGRGTADGGPLEHLAPLSIAVVDLAALTPPAEPTLLVVDQFEEAEQLDPDGQAAVFDALAALPETVELCVVAVTAGSFGFAMRDERFAAHLASPVLVGPLTADEYTEIIEEPARQHGRQVARELVDLALRDLRHFGDPSPGTALPLLSSAMRRAWQAAQGTTITAADYLGTGGLWSALDDEAEAVLLATPEHDRAVAKRLILSMVQVEGETILRRKISYAGLTPEMRGVLDGFVQARLMTIADGQIAISHDALLTRWQRLGQWVEEERASLLIARRIHMAAQLWDEGGRHDEALMPVEAELWETWTQAEDTPLLTATENDFIEASLQLALRRQQEQRHHVSRLRRRQWVAMAAAALAIVMMLIAVVAGFRSESYRYEAEAATLTAQGRQVALIADEVRPVSPNTAGQLSVAANSIDDSVQTRSAMLKSAGSPMPTRAVGPTGNTMVAHIPDHALIVRGDSTGQITMWRDADLTTPPVEAASDGGQLFALAATSLDGRALALVGGQRTAGVWDLTGEPRKIADFGTDTVTYAASWQGSTLYFGTLEGEIRRVDFSTPDSPEILEPLELGESVVVTALATSADRILPAGRQDRVEVFAPDGE
ncbi:MAG: hypothetical protein GX596_14865, partial [Propionibacterium sp.]|nr:hypothetical protein [Propionibacterium sp.]